MDEKALAVLAELQQTGQQFEADMQRIVDQAIREIWDRYLMTSGRC